MFMECDDIAILRTRWDAVVDGDPEAKLALIAELKGIVLSVHALSLPDGDYVSRTAREVCAALGDRMTLTIGFDN